MPTQLESWNDGAVKSAILDFVMKVTTPGSPDFVPEPERIATFDNDGTLWCEQPVPVQAFFAFDRVKALAPQHPEWVDQEPFASLLKGNLNAALAGGDRALLELLMATHTGMTTVEFEQIVKDWIAAAKHPKYKRPYTECVYQPMLELLAYLRANGFKIFIVSGGGIEFMRAWSEQVYGIPPEQIIGSSIQTKFEIRDGQPVLVRLPQLNFNSDKDGKPVAINQHIGRRPLMAFGNSTGDQQMLEYTQGGSGARFMLLILHDDAAREYPYGPARGLPDVKLGAFPPALDEQAKKDGWIVVSMKDDWKQIFPFEQNPITAIDILLEPDATMLQHAEANNARLLGSLPERFRPGCGAPSAHHHAPVFRPHGGPRQGLCRSRKGVRCRQSKRDEAGGFKYYYVPAGATGVAGISRSRRRRLLKLQADIIAAVEAVHGANRPHRRVHRCRTKTLLSSAALIQYVSTFVPKACPARISIRTSAPASRPKEYLDKMLDEPFELFTFSPAGAAVYQLGPFGTAAKKLKEWALKL